MGASLSWLLAKKTEEAAILSELEASPDPAVGELAFCMTRSADGLIHLFEARGRHWQFGFNNVRREKLSIGRGIWFCVLEEHTMISECCFWENGREVWGVCHDYQTGDIFHLEERGELPGSYYLLKDRAIREQKIEGDEDWGVDLIISVPMVLSKQMTGYDGNFNGPVGEYIEL